MEINHQRIDEIYRILLFRISGFTIQKKSNHLNSFRSIVIHWLMTDNDNSGFFISCPRDLNTDLYLCEICFIDKDNMLYSCGNEREKIMHYEELLSQFYFYFFRFIILYNLPFCILKFHIKNRVNRHVHRLESICRYHLTTLDLTSVT